MEKKNETSVHRIGSVTGGVSLILFGSLFLLNAFWPGIDFRFVFRLWPCILIMMGAEILIGNFKKTERFVYDKGAVFLMILLMLFCLIPFLLLLVSSFTAESALLKNGYSFFPSEISFDAYKALLVDSSSIFRGYFLSFVVTVTGTLSNVVLTLLFAYPLSRRDLPGKGFFSFMVFFTMLFNGGLVPTYMMWTGVFNIKNTLCIAGKYSILEIRKAGDGTHNKKQRTLYAFHKQSKQGGGHP